MNASPTVDVLNRLYRLHHRSLAAYLSYAAPFSASGNGTVAQATLAQIATAHRRSVDRIGEMIMDYEGDVVSGAFPMSFTSLHDLGMDFLVQKLIEHQRQIISGCEQCVADLSLAPMARALAEEALGEARGHLESLQELGSDTPSNA